MHLFEGSQLSAVSSRLFSSLSSSLLSLSPSSFTVYVVCVCGVLLCVAVCCGCVCGCALCCGVCAVCVEVAHSPKFPSEELELNSLISLIRFCE